jgi:DNA-directed RNA polymerase subunit M/transcription elongation factor TFIIS
MIYTQHFCAKCGSAAIRRNGSKEGQPKYQCTACHYQGLFVPAAVRKAAQYAQVDALLSERNSQLATQHRPAHGGGPVDDCQTDKKSGAPLATPAAAALGQSPAQAVGSARTR